MDSEQAVFDKRPVKSLWCYNNDSDLMVDVGREGVTKIEPYTENGQMAPVLWFKVWKGEFLWKRFNAAHLCEVKYVESPEGEKE